MKIRDWVKLPSRWMEEGGLKDFQWKNEGSSQLAALMVLIGIAHHANREDGIARLPYDRLEMVTHLSRTKIADGLKCLEQRNLVIREPEGRSTYQLARYDPERGWTMLPAKGLYSNGGIRGFEDFRLRSRNELEAVKAYLAIAARRDRKFNRAHLTYEKLEDYAGIPQARIKSALSVLTTADLIVTEQFPSNQDRDRIATAYRLKHLNPSIHQGTTGRELLAM